LRRPGVAVADRGGAELAREGRDLLVEWSGHGDHVAALTERHELPLAAARDLLPNPRGLAVGAALDRVHDDVLPHGLLHRAGVRGVLHIVHVRRRVADQEHQLEGLAVGAPRELVDRVRERLVDRLGAVATAVGGERAQLAVHRVEVGAQVVELGDVRVAAVAVSDQPDADLGSRSGAHQLVGDRPDLGLGAFDEASHRASRVEHERHLDARLRRRWHHQGDGRGRFSRRGRRRRRGRGGEADGRRPEGDTSGEKARDVPSASDLHEFLRE
jgi:hypothetical protein